MWQWLPAWALPAGLLVISNLFMTVAWYGHLKFKHAPLWIVILISWGIALFEYCFQVPANRWGHQYLSAAQLKTIQEVITFTVFTLFSVFYLNEKVSIGQLFGFSLIILGAFFVFRGK